MNTRMCYGSMVSSRQTREFGTAGEGGPSPEMVLEAELIDLRESDEIVDLTCESLEPTVIDLTCHDSVVITEERRRRGGNTRSFQGQTGSSVVSSDKEELMRNRDVYVTDSTCHNALEEEAYSIFNWPHMGILDHVNKGNILEMVKQVDGRNLGD
uniref:Uncharacterized protein n=1 Tax=Canis lupus familiaris TaxID=9615 RepID=A0A8C0NI05_CANLF